MVVGRKYLENKDNPCAKGQFANKLPYRLCLPPGDTASFVCESWHLRNA